MSNFADAYRYARDRYADIGVDTEAAIAKLDAVPISLHCWQGDDVAGFEPNDGGLTGGIAATGNYPGAARTPDELRADLELALSLLPGPHKINLHANYRVGGPDVDRDKIGPEHFTYWTDWAREKGLGLDFNPTFYSHPHSADGYTLASRDEGIRRFWIEHGICCRRLGRAMGEATGQRCVVNLWIPDGEKEWPVDALAPRARLKDSLDQIYAEKIPGDLVLDAVESKLFGLGSESYVAGSHEFYLCYCMAHPELALTLDLGHFHPTESIAAKLSALSLFLNHLLLHTSRPVRWDSDHVVAFDDSLRDALREVVRLQALDRIALALDYFDASINRIAAWVVGMRNTRRALLCALLEPTENLRQMEARGDLAGRLALLEALKGYPSGIVFDEYLRRHDLPAGNQFMAPIYRYEADALSSRT